MLRRPKSSDSTRPNPPQGVSSLVYHTPPPSSHGRPNWMCLSDIPDENCYETVSTPVKPEDSNIWDGNKKLFVQLLDDMDNIGGVEGEKDGSARRRKKARELFTDWLFRSKMPDKPDPPPSPQLRQTRNNNMHRYSGDFSNYNVQIPVTESPKPEPGKLERQAPSRRSCGMIGERKHLYAKWRHSSVHVSNEDEADSGYHSGNSVILGTVVGAPRRPGELTLSRQDLKKRIDKFNCTNTHGLLMEMPVDRSSLFEGFIRVHMSLIRPINMRVCKTPPTFVATLKRNKHKNKIGGDGDGDNLNNNNTTNSNTTNNNNNTCKLQFNDFQSIDSQVKGGDGGVNRGGGVKGSGEEVKGNGESLISFSLPKNTSKVIHINSSTKTSEVVSLLLSKFNICDSPRKFSLYERIELPANKPSMRKMMEDEQPLMMCLVWEDTGGLDHHRFVLQENDAGEIMWEAFSPPELESFLTVLNKEEMECIRQVKGKYRLQKIQLTRRLKEFGGGVGSGSCGGVGKSKKLVNFCDGERSTDHDTFSSTREATVKCNLRYHKQHRSLDSSSQPPSLPFPPFQTSYKPAKIEDV